MFRVMCSIFVAALALPGCTDLCSGIGGDQCSEPTESSRDTREYHLFNDPHLVRESGIDGVVMLSNDTDDVAKEYDELALPLAPEPIWRTTPIPHMSPVFACGASCLVVWRDYTTGMLYASLRTGGVWSAAYALETRGDRAVVAARAEGFFVASISDASVTLQRLDAIGRSVNRFTLASDAMPGHLSVAASPTGGLVTWQVEKGVFAQLLDETGAPTGAALAMPIDMPSDQRVARGAVFADGMYRVAHDGLEDAPWFIVDPVARTITPEKLPIVGDISQLIALPHGVVAVAKSSTTMGYVVESGSITRSLALPISAQLTPNDDGSFTLIHSVNSSVFSAAIPPSFDQITAQTPLAEIYELDSGCNAGGSASLLPAMCLLALRKRRRK